MLLFDLKTEELYPTGRLPNVEEILEIVIVKLFTKHFRRNDRTIWILDHSLAKFLNSFQ